MTEDYYEIPILKLLTIPNDATRWVIIKKALAADVKKTDTKAVEFAYRDLVGAERHLIRLSEETSEFINVPVDLEPADDADKYSGGPKLLAFAKKHGVRKAPVVISVATDDESEVDDVEKLAETDEASSIQNEAVAIGAPEDDDVPVPEEKTAAEVTTDTEEKTDDEEQASLNDAVLRMYAELDFGPEGAPAEEIDRPEQEDLPVASSMDQGVSAESHPDGVEEVNEPIEVETFHVDLEAVLAHPDEKARWILLKKLVAFVRNRKHVRSLSAEDLGDEANATSVLRSFGTGFDIPVGGEPKDKSDETRHATSLQEFAAGAVALAGSRSDEARPEASSSTADKDLGVDGMVDASDAPSSEDQYPAEGDEAGLAPMSSDIVLARFDIHLDDGVNEALEELSGMGDEGVLLAAAEVLARRLELEASNLRLRIASKAYRN